MRTKKRKETKRHDEVIYELFKKSPERNVPSIRTVKDSEISSRGCVASRVKDPKSDRQFLFTIEGAIRNAKLNALIENKLEIFQLY